MSLLDSLLGSVTHGDAEASPHRQMDLDFVGGRDGNRNFRTKRGEGHGSPLVQKRVVIDY